MIFYIDAPSTATNGTMTNKVDGSTLLKGIQTENDHYTDAWVALKEGDAHTLRTAVSRLSTADLDRCHILSMSDAQSIPEYKLPLAMQEVMSHQDKRKITLVHYAVLKGDKLCLEVILNGGANPNIKDIFGQTPMHILPGCRLRNSDKDFRGCLNTLLAQEHIDTNRLDWSSSTPYIRAEEGNWSYMMDRLREIGKKVSVTPKGIPSVQEKRTVLADALLRDLLSNNLDAFRNTLGIIGSSGTGKEFIIDESHGSYTLLQYACRFGKVNFVDELLKYGASPTKKIDINILSPVSWASKYGYHDILQRLVQCLTHEALNAGALRVCNETMETPLHMCVMCTSHQSTEDINYYYCLQILLEQKDFLDLDAKNDDGNTALHFAALCHDLRAFSDLLINGANFTINNVVGLSPLNYVDKEGMVKILDSFIEYNKSEKMIDKDFWITLHYHMMDHERYDSKNQINPAKCSNLAETNFINLVADIFQDKDILNHPFLSIFIDIKWLSIRRYFYMNFAIHFTFLLLLVSYIILFHSEPDKPLVSNSSTPPLRTPISFPGNKTESTLTGSEGSESEGSLNDSKDSEYLRKIFEAVLLITLSVWQIVQLFMMKSWKIYFQDLKKIIEVISIILTAILLFSPLSASVKMGLAAWVILFASLEFILQLGQLPQFAVYVTMFNAIAWNFFLFISLFSGVILAFSYSFYLMLKPSTDMFKNYLDALVKTIVMTTGELEYNDLHMSNSTYPIATQVLMVLFVFVVILVLMNLLNGLAISDIQEIQKKAEVISLMSLIHRMTQLERAFHCGRNYNPLKMILDFLFKITLTFKHCLPKHRLTLYVSRNPVEYSSDDQQRKTICKCHPYKVQAKHIKALMKIVLEKRSAMSRHRN